MNKNSIPFDPLPPMKAGGLRMGTPAVTTRGMREPDMEKIAVWIGELLLNLGDAATEQRVRGEVAELASKFPLLPPGALEAAERRCRHCTPRDPAISTSGRASPLSSGRVVSFDFAFLQNSDL